MANNDNQVQTTGETVVVGSINKVIRNEITSHSELKKFNTYNYWHKFAAFNDLFPHGYEKVTDEKTKAVSWQEFVANPNGDQPTKSGKGFGSPAARSLFNKTSAVMVGGKDNYKNPFNASEWRLSNNVPLMDSPYNRREIRKISGCTVGELVDASRNGQLGVATYSYSDFMYCKYLGKIPNNYLITLRRFPIPVTDFISALALDEPSGKGRRGAKHASKINPPVGTMVTWIGTPGNEMTNLLKYSFKMPYEWKDSQYNQVNGGADDNTGVFNSIASAFDSKYREQYMAGTVGGAFNSYIGKFFPGGAGSPPYSIDSLNSWRDENKVYGPIDVVKGTYMRGSKGLEFEQKITLQFDYELRSYNGINPRQAMLDLLSNILVTTYSTGSFWGGGYIGGGASQNNIFANLDIFKKGKSGFTDYVGSFVTDFGNITDHISKAITSAGGLLKFLGNALNALGGMFIGSALNKLGRPAKVQAASLLSPAPVGFWHITIGNPRHPIMSMGNMILLNTTIEHYGPLGLDDFPTGLRVICELERGKPRDSRDIEKIYMHGNDRIFSSMGPALKSMYDKAESYEKYDNAQDSSTTKTPENKVQQSDKNENTTATTTTPVTGTDEGAHETEELKKIYFAYFGTDDRTDIEVTSKEQEYGSQGKTESPKQDGQEGEAKQGDNKNKPK